MSDPMEGERAPIAGVREGMEAVDPAGNLIGTVVEVRMSDPAAEASSGRHEAPAAEERGLLGAVVDFLAGGTELPRADRLRLLRLGYLRVDTGAVINRDKYADARQVGSVEGDVVHLTVSERQMVS